MTIGNHVIRFDTFGENFQCIAMHFENGIENLESIFYCENRKIDQEYLDRAFRTYADVKRIKTQIKKIDPQNRLLFRYNTFIQSIPALKEIAALKELFHKTNLKQKQYTLSSCRVATSRFQKNLLGLHIDDMYAVFKEKAINPLQWKEIWECVQRRIFSRGEEYRSFFQMESLRDKKIVWLSGSSSSSLVPIFQRQIEGRPALIPTGLLLLKNIVPLTGMLDIGLAGINQHSLSGVMLDSSDVAIQYAEKCRTASGYIQEMEILCIHSFLNRIIKLKNDKFGFLDKVYFIRAKIAAIRLAWFGLEQEKKQQVSNTLESYFKLIQNQEMYCYIQEIKDLILYTEKFIFSPEEEELVHNPASIVWASVSKKAEDLMHVRSDITGEKALLGPQEIGRDIQILFVEPSKYDKVCNYVRRYLSPSELHIMSMEVLSFIHSHTLGCNQATSFL